jgi:hypothetical protein
MNRTATTGIAPLTVGIIALTVATAAVHVYLGLLGFPLFFLNGLGYLTLLAALYLPIPALARYRRAARWVLAGYAALTVILWMLVGERSVVGYADKVVEVALISLLVLEDRGTLQP